MPAPTSTIAVALFYSIAAAAEPPVTVVSPCECRDAYGKERECLAKEFLWSLITNLRKIYRVRNNRTERRAPVEGVLRYGDVKKRA